MTYGVEPMVVFAERPLDRLSRQLFYRQAVERLEVAAGTIDGSGLVAGDVPQRKHIDNITFGSGNRGVLSQLFVKGLPPLMKAGQPVRWSGRPQRLKKWLDRIHCGD